MRKRVNGFITVEYTLLISVLIIMYGLMIGIGLFMYNQCIMHSNTCILTVESLHTSAMDAARKITYLQQVEENLYQDKYLFASHLQTSYDIKGDRICIEGQGRMYNPLNAFGIGQVEWGFYVPKQVTAISPQDILRLCKRLLTIKEDIMIEGESEGE